MNKHDLEVFLVCFCGAFIGTLVAIWAGVLWPIGLLVGAVIGYFAVEWRKVPIAVKYAVQNIPKSNYRLSVDKKRAWKILIVVLANFSLGTLLLVVIVAPFEIWEKSQKPFDLSSVWAFYLGAIIVYSAFAFGLSDMLIVDVMGKKGRRTLDNYYQWCLVYNNAFALVLWWLPKLVFYRLPMGVFYYLPRGVYFTAIWLIEVVALTLRLIHSHLRVLCAAYAAVGTLIGWYFASPLIGAIVGGVFGFIAFKLIFSRIYAKTSS